MADTDPKTTITETIVDHLGAITLDVGCCASVGIMWESGPETLKYLFDTVAYDAVITIGEPQTRSIRAIQDVPVHYLMRYPITVTSVNKPLTGVVLTSTAARIQYKITYALRLAIAVHAQSVAGAGPPAWVMRIVTDVAKHRRIGGLDVWQATHYVEYETGYP